MRSTLVKFAVLALFSCAPFFIFADSSPVPITLDVETYDSQLYNGPLSVSECSDSNTASTTSINVYCAVSQAAAEKHWALSSTWYSFGLSLDGLDQYTSDPVNNRYWLYFVNGEPASVGLVSYHLQPNDKILLVYGTSPLRISAASQNIKPNEITAVSAQAFDFNAWAWRGVSGADFYIDGSLTTTSLSGAFDFSKEQAGSFTIVSRKSGYLDSSPLSITVVAEAPSPAPSIAGGSCGACGHVDPPLVPKPSFNVAKATIFLKNNQLSDGSFGNSMLSDWAAIALASVENADLSFLVSYFTNHQFDQTVLTDIERHAMALMALGLNPYDFLDRNFIGEIEGSFRGGQFGDPLAVNDDIFAVIALRSAGVPSDDPQILAAAGFILGSQEKNGGWGSPDLTAAALEALSLLKETSEITASENKALDYLRSVQFGDGGYANVFSASWVAQGLVAVGQNPDSWINNGKSLSDYLVSMQEEDGGARTDASDRNSRVWASAYAIPAALKLSLPQILGRHAPFSTRDEGKSEEPLTQVSLPFGQSPVVSNPTTTIAVATSSFLSSNQQPTKLSKNKIKGDEVGKTSAEKPALLLASTSLKLAGPNSAAAIVSLSNQSLVTKPSKWLEGAGAFLSALLWVLLRFK